MAAAAGKGKTAAAVAADIKTNPNWVDIRYDPQHHRFARNGNPTPYARHNPAALTRSVSLSAGASRPGLWSGLGAKVRTGLGLGVGVVDKYDGWLS